MTSADARSLACLTETGRAALRSHAESAYPQECCGLVFDTGVVRCTNVADARHAADPLAFPRTGRRAFRLADHEQLRLARSFDGPTPARVLYHSHVDAEAYFSAADLAGSTLDGQPLYPTLLHVVVAVRDGRAGEMRAYAIEEGQAIPRARFPATGRDGTRRPAGNGGPRAPRSRAAAPRRSDVPSV